MDDFDRLLEIQRSTASRIRVESEVDNKIKILDILNNLAGRRGKKMQVEEVILEGANQGLSEDEVVRTLDALKDDGIIKEPEIGFIQFT